MNIKNLFTALLLCCFVIVGCQKEVKKEKVSLAISGMTCEIGCAKTIQSKLSKKEGVLDAKVIFADSIATVEYDTNTTSKEDLIAFVGGIAGGDLYTASEASNGQKTSKKSHACKKNCKEKCELEAAKKGCCKKDTVDGKMVCAKDCEMACCVEV